MIRTNETTETLFARQMEMEDQAMAMGGQRFRRKLEAAVQHGTEARTGAASKLLSGGLEKVEKALQALVDDSSRGMNRSVAKKWVTLLGADVAAYLALKVVLDHVHARVSVRKAAMEVTELILDELRFRRFKEKEPRLFEYCMTGFTTSSYAHRARSLDARIHHAEVDVSDIAMTQNERFTVGVKLLEVVREVTGLVEVQSKKAFERKGRATEQVELVATAETLAWLEQGNAALETLYPVNLPMVMPPLPWAPGQPGGYRFALRGKHRLVRSNSKAQRDLIRSADMKPVYEAVNRIQETPWRVNRRVLEVIDALVNRGGGIAGIPVSSDQALPTKPLDMESNEEARKAWRRAASLVHEENHEARVARRSLFDLLNVANKVRDEAAIWFPHNLDFRGRVYPVTSYLHPQGNDMTKALLEFADGAPVGTEGAKYLALHGAACMDKTPDGRKLGHMTVEERLEWVASIEADVVAIAADPLSNTMWMDAEERWCFLAWCFDYAGYVREGPSYVSHLAVAMDGTCNGLQHFAALWLDPVGGAAVNVVPSERPQDIYQSIADEVLSALEKDSANQFAALWLQSKIVDRSLCKRPVMTFGYGSEKFGFSQQLFDKVTEVISEKASHLKALFAVEVVDEETGEVTTRSCLFAACSYMAGLIWDALKVVSVSAFSGMAWMRKCAKVISKDGQKQVQWIVPSTGFPVVQSYVEETVSRTRTVLAGSVFWPRIWHPTDTPAWKKQTSSVAPNIVHSLDAAALMLTVNMAAGEGVDSFAMIHDSYGTLAGDAPVLARCTRQAFYNSYTQHDVVANLQAQFEAQVEGCTVDGKPVVIPEAPAKGVDGQLMDLGGVLLSPYFFS